MRRITNVHFVGIGGVGMAGIAEVMLSLGYSVSGSDLTKNSLTERLTSLGAEITYSHIASNVYSKDVLVISSAVPEANIEVITAKAMRIPVIPRGQMLFELMRFKQGIAVAGTHGKTTTTSILSTIFAQAGLDPTFVVGGKLNNFGFNAKLGQSDYFIAEADESDASFLHLTPSMIIVTNIDGDHLENYSDNIDSQLQAFIEFIHNMPFYGLCVLCKDDPNIQKILPKISRPFLSYGFHLDADYRIINYEVKDSKTKFTLLSPQAKEYYFELNLIGKHNILNAVATIILAQDVGVSMNIIAKALKEFKGVGRRLQRLGIAEFAGKDVTLLDDYGHHPTELRCVIDALRENYPGQNLIMIFQPHRYTRTEALFEEFTEVLSKPDNIILLDVYSAGEKPIKGADTKSLCRNIRKHGVEPIYVKDTSELATILGSIAVGGDIVITQGAGSVGKISHMLASIAVLEY